MDWTPKSFKLDTEVAADLKETAQREERTETAIVERALRDYIARSKAEAAKTDKKAKVAA